MFLRIEAPLVDRPEISLSETWPRSNCPKSDPVPTVPEIHRGLRETRGIAGAPNPGLFRCSANSAWWIGRDRSL